MMNTAQKQWIRMIHVAKTKLNLDDERYRALLTGACGVESSKEIKTWKQYDAVMASFAKLGFDYKSKSYKANTAPQEGRNPKWISEKQEKYIRGLWQLVADNKSDKALEAFIERITGSIRIEWLRKYQATDVIVALRKMACEKGINPDRKD